MHKAVTQRGYTLPKEYVFVDENYSGARLDRPGLDRLRDLAAEGAFEVILVAAPDRLARHYAYQVVVLEELKRVGCTVEFLNHAFSQNPEEQMLLQIQAVFAEYERALIRERTRRGRLYAAKQGRVNWGNPPYGYHYIRRTATTQPQLLIEESEAAVVRQMYEWLVVESLTSYAVAKRLSERHIPTRKATSQGWSQSSVIEILREPLYKGTGYVNRTTSGDGQRPRMGRSFKDQYPGNGRVRVARPREEWIEVSVPALISDELWARAQEQLAYNRQRATRNNTQHQYLLQSLVVCGKCGKRMIGTWAKHDKGRYVCAYRYPRTAPGRCDGRSVAVDRLDREVWEYVQALLSDADLLRQQYVKVQAEAASTTGVGQDETEVVRLERRIEGQGREVQRLIDAYTAEAIELDELKARRQHIEAQKGVLVERVNQLKRERANQQEEQRLLLGLDEFCESISGALEQPSFGLKQQILRLVVDTIVIESDKIVVKHIVPTHPVRLQTEQHVCGTPY